MIWAKDSLAVGQGMLAHPNGVTETPGPPIGAGEAVARDQGVATSHR